MDRARLAERMATRFGWRILGDPPPDPVVVMVGAPHTSNWDFPLMLWMMWARGLEPRFLMKKEAFRGPAGAVLRRLGGIPVDRSAAAGLGDDLVARAEQAEHHFTIVIAPEGTRRHGRYWKSGFYRIARQANIPICLSFIGGPGRTIGFGPSFLPSGDVVADMDLVREFYADKPGVKPGRKTEPRLREEDERAGGTQAAD
jgi:1-acyl-sn-glycerol-3-phosphate acyltransferase